MDRLCVIFNTQVPRRACHIHLLRSLVILRACGLPMDKVSSMEIVQDIHWLVDINSLRVVQWQKLG